MNKKQVIFLLRALQKKPLVMLDITLYMLQDNVIYRTEKILHIFGKIAVEVIRGKLANCKKGVFTVRPSLNYL
jgi:hypothetical protein